MGNFGIDVDPKIVRGLFPALRQLSDQDIVGIFLDKFIDSGLPASPFTFKENMIQYCNSLNGTAKLEVGPFDQPILQGEGVEYFDILDQEALKHRAVEHERNPSSVPFIHHVSDVGDLGVVSRSFDIVFSSHCIEHTPDLITHLQQVGALLTPNGAYYLVIPDKRYCFDFHLPETLLPEILSAYHARRSSPSMDKVLEHRTMLAHNNALRHWMGDHGAAGELKGDIENIKEAITEFQGADGYIDVHCWQFTPQSFVKLLQDLRSLDLIPFSSAAVNLTPFGRKDFTAVLTI